MTGGTDLAGRVTMQMVEPAAADCARILVIDDDERNLLAIETVLADLAEVVVARSGEEALRHLLKGDFAVILLDVYMPEMDGYETARLIRGREQTKRIPIIFLSAVNKETEHLMRGYTMGAVDYVFKPVEPVVLRSKVAVFVDLYMMRREIVRKAEQEQRLLDANLYANTELLRAEQEVRLAEQRQTAIIESLPIIFYLEEVDAKPRAPKFVSGNFFAVTGYHFEEIRSSPDLWEERLHVDDRDRVMAMIDSRDSGRSFAIEYRWQCADGAYRHFLDQAVLLCDPSGEPLEYAGTLLDITERKGMEAELLHIRKMDAIGKMTGGIAHDFNNLLAAVLGGLGLIERRVPLTPDQLKIVSMTRHAAEHGADLVARLMAFAREQKLEPAPIDIERFSCSVKELMAHTLGGLVELKWEVDNGLWHAYADEAQLELAVMNLIINARDAMPDGGVVTISAHNVTVADQLGMESGDYILLNVTDTGSGIPPEILEHVIEPFFTTKPIGKGTGLGLSMVYGFTQQSDGMMRIESEPGRGTSVRLWLPRAIDGERADALPVSLAETVQPSNHTGPLNIILVDDHPAVRATTAALLCDLGHKVRSAANARQALGLFKVENSPVDVMITDYAMPQISGVELINRVRAIRPAVPAIIITGNTDGTLGDDGTMIVLTKPFTPEQLVRALQTALAETAA